ncbi:MULTISPECIES: glycosyltransferase family 4 protein [unclassified Ensifer]|uniref:glycosyltransferase family 4 protein n=1 Tax=unclassified Ensifer TaxID=2633371 RepID=UPI000712D207|nr:MULTISPECIES: glycosyltransferase family 1 protein [unclassified Ensifer]KQX44809.1 hypothetical protein ASD49_06995 [Ensifer sp. Root1298]KQX76651.1 hypothetical protein ASD41_07245 [Ensifer sp. Root1312]KRC17163.1 hypothetical protein ASE29_07890 [Ensifer sp. Root74]KRD62193.1 hypothetical protein ASE71_07965 [Ensifer sp. Root954]
MKLEIDREAIALRPAEGEVLPKWGKSLVRSLANKAPVVWIDVSDFLAYARDGNVTVSGIQRVTANLITNRHLAGLETIPVIPEFDRLRFLAADPLAMEQLVIALQSGMATREEIEAHMYSVYESRVELWPRMNDRFVMVGAFWIYYNHDLLIKFRNTGVRNVLFVHDLIQLKNPEYLSAIANRTFRRSLVDVLAVCDHILTNSEFVKGEVESFIATRLNLSLPVRAVQLPTELPATEAVTSAPASLAELEDQEFILCVGTIEIRKNHLYLMNIWKNLSLEGRIKLPKLVFVGKWGWNVEPLKEEITRTEATKKWLRIYNNVTDNELNYLYRRCLFTIYPSFAEGWGLPVGESLAYGKLCVTSDTTSMPEVGGDFAEYINPFDVADGLNTVRGLLADRSAIADWEQRIKEGFVPKTWSAFCGEFFGALQCIPDTGVTAAVSNFSFNPGIFYSLGAEELPLLDRSGDLLVTARMSRKSGWLPCGEDLAWVNGTDAVIEFQTDFKAGVKLQVYCEVILASAGTIVRLNAGAGYKLVAVHPARQQVFKLDGLVGADGVLRVRALCSGTSYVLDEELGPVYFGLSSIAFIRADDAGARNALLEMLTIRGYSRSQAVREGDAAGVGSVDAARFAIRFLSNSSGSSFVNAGRLWLEAARFAARRHHWRLAEIFYTRHLRSSPGNASAWKQLGHALKEQSMYEGALFAYSICREVDPADREVDQHFKHVKAMLKKN